MILGSLTLGEWRGAYRLLSAADPLVGCQPAANSIRHLRPNGISGIRGGSDRRALTNDARSIPYVLTDVIRWARLAKRSTKISW